MNISIPVPTGFIERHNVSSGPIKRTGFAKYGVIFTSSDDESDSFFTSDILEGAEITGESGSDSFRIIGGYYLIKDESKTKEQEVRTIHVFGVAGGSNLGFEMVENGEVLIGDHWSFDGGSIFKSSDINERKSNVKNGWTFIVEEDSGKKKGDFPSSGDDLKIWVDCPVITDLLVRFDAPEAEIQPISVEIETSGEHFENYLWDWGEGASLESTTSPVATHRYKRPVGLPRAEFEISVIGEGPANCRGDINKRVEIPGCPSLQANTSMHLEKETVVALLDVQVSGPDPDMVSVNWGDSDDWEAATSSPVEHVYVRTVGEEKVEYEIVIRSVGPDVCTTQTSIFTEIPGCPQLTLSKNIETEKDGIHVTLIGALKGPDPDRMTVDWGLGDGEQAFERFPISQIYPRLSGESKLEYEIRVVASGPDVCEAIATEEVLIQGCPSLDTQLETTINGEELVVIISGEIKGSDPDSIMIDWGDESETVDSFPATHTYPRPGGIDFEDHKIQVSLNGPGDCFMHHTHDVRIPGCPILSLVKEENVSPTGMQIVLGVEVEGPQPDLFTINWGDNKKASFTTKFPISRNYPRPAKQDFRDYEITVVGAGPEGCQSTLKTEVRVVGCPRIKAKAKSQLFPDRVELLIEGKLEGPAPDNISINWGDGSPVQPVNDFPISHTFARPMGVENTEYEVVLDARGPLDCWNEFRHTQLVPGCPVLELISATDLSATGMQLMLDLKVTGPSPEIYTINWGDGKGATPAGKFPVSRNFPRPLGELQKEYEIEISAVGPAECQQLLSTQAIVPGCPALKLTPSASLSPTGMQVQLQLVVEGPVPNLYTLDWGDELGATPLSGFPASRNFPRPIGEIEKQYDIRLNSVGPDECRAYANAHVTVPGCPQILMQVESELLATELVVTVSGEIKGPAPDSLMIDWGYGERPMTGFPVSHSYPRPLGKDMEVANIHVTGKGPDVCISEAKTTIEIPGCPVLEPEIRSDLSVTHLTAVMSMGVKGPNPETYTVDWGDGEEPQPVSRFPIIHQFARPQGMMYIDQTIRIEALGPDKCMTEAIERLRIPGCPVLNVATKTVLGGTKLGVELQVSATGPQPESYAVDWGDGTGFQTISRFPANHEYPRTSGVDKTDFTVRVVATGPDECLTEAIAPIEVPGCPALTLQARQWLSSKGLRVTVNIKVKGPRPDSYEVDWGEGAKRERISELPATHIYDRTVGIDQAEYEITVDGKGPGLCESSERMTVVVPGCPDLLLEMQQELKAEEMVLILGMQIEGPVPDTYTIEWGDGTISQEVKNFPQRYTYPRPKGEMGRDYPLLVKAVGPDKCRTEVAATVSVPGCPNVELVKLIEIQRQKVQVTVGNRVRGPKPDRYEIDWGDGKGMQHIWEFPVVLAYERPVGEVSREYEISLVAYGPDKCIHSDKDGLTVPGCPLISHQLETDLATEYLRATLKAEWSGPEPEEVWVDWGDHVEAIPVKQFPVHHNYPRMAGVEYRDYELKLIAKGPHDCLIEITEDVQVPGCPLLEIAEMSVLSPTGMQVTIDATTTGPLPDLFVVNWGDGKQATPLTEFPVSRNFPRPAGEEYRDYDIKLTASGPDVCVTEQETSVRVPGCPRLRLSTNTNLSGTGMQVTLDVEVEGPTPELFVVNWGDDKGALPTTKFPVSRNYPRPAGIEFREYEIEVRATGPDQCITETHTSVQVPGCPRISIKHEIEVSATGAKVLLDAVVEGPAPDLYIVNWGDDKGASPVGNLPVSRNYPRPAGKEMEEYQILIRAVGPAECITEIPLAVQIPGCPRVYMAVEEQVNPTDMTVSINTRYEGPEPEAYEVDWGDGRDFLEVTNFPIVHAYPRPPGKISEEVTIAIRASGPGLCLTEPRTTVIVPGCPILEVSTRNKLTESVMRVSLVLKIIGPDPDMLWIDWGDEEGREPLGEFPYVHEYSRPMGEDSRTVEIKVFGDGPQGCKGSAMTIVEIPGCPEINIVEELTETPDGLLVILNVDVSGPEPDSYKVHWGVGKKTTPVVSWPLSRLYPYPFGLTHEDRTIRILAKGPGKCKTDADLEIQVPGCPTLDIWTTCNVLPDTVEVTVNGTTEGPPVNGYSIDWGQMKGAMETEVLPKMHVYPRTAGVEYEDITIEVAILGFTHCEVADQASARIPGCPKWEISLDSNVLPEEVEVVLSGSYEGPVPDEIRVDWGSGSRKVSGLPLTYTYPRPLGEMGANHTVRLVSTGPEGCITDWSEGVFVIGCPKITSELDIQVHEKKLEVSMNALWEGPDPNLITVDWGSEVGPFPVSDFPVMHEYPRPEGIDGKYEEIVLLAAGPEGCTTTQDHQVWIPGCPTLDIETLKKIYPEYALITLSGTTQGPDPDVIEVDWGDGKGKVEVERFPVTHKYPRSPGRNSDEYEILVEVTAEPNCRADARASVSVPGCPLIKIGSKRGKTSKKKQTMIFKLKYSGPKPDYYIWDWGQGEVEKIKGDGPFKHVYKRPPLDEVYKVTVRAIGPYGCETEAGAKVIIEGTCPRIEEVRIGYGELQEERQKVTLFAVIKGATQPEKYLWDWGDGSGIYESNEPWASHEYVRPEDHSENYTASVQAVGPVCGKLTCEISKSILVEVSGKCPVVVDLSVVYGTADVYTQPVQVISVYRGQKPLSYTWDWGDGSPLEIGVEPFKAHNYELQRGANRIIQGNVTITVVRKKGGTCTNIENFEIEVPGIVETSVPLLN